MAKTKQPKEKPPGQTTQIDIAVNKIVNMGFTFEEASNVDEKMNLSYGLKVQFDTNRDAVIFIITSNYKNLETKSTLFTSKTMTEFFVANLKQFMRPGDTSNVTIPDNVMHILFGMAFTHARAIQAVNVAGTKFGSLVLPIVNPGELFDNIMHAAGIQRSPAVPVRTILDSK